MNLAWANKTFYPESKLILVIPLVDKRELEYLAGSSSRGLPDFQYGNIFSEGRRMFFVKKEMEMVTLGFP